MSRYSDTLQPLVHRYADKLEILDRGAYYYRIVEGLDPVPSWLVVVAEKFKKSGIEVFKDAIQYRFSMQYQYNKDKYVGEA